MSGTAERQARRLLVAYPWRVRAEQGDEIVGTVLDALPPGRDRLPARDRLDLVRGGLRTRLRRRISLWGYLRYVFQGRLPERWLPWVIDDLEAPGFRRRVALRSALNLAVLVTIFSLGGGWSWPWTVGVVAAGSIGSALRAEVTRRLTAERHGLVPGTGVPGMVWVLAPEHAPLPNIPVARVLAALGGPVAGGGVACVVAVANQGRRGGGVEVHSAAPADVLARCVPYVGAGAALAVAIVVVAGLGARRARRSTAPAPLRSVRGTTITSVVLSLGLSVGATDRAVALWWQREEWATGLVASGAAPLGLGLLVVAAVLGGAGRRRSRPVGLWELAPTVGPRRDVVAVAEWAVDLMPGADVLDPAGRRAALLRRAEAVRGVGR